MIRDYLNKIVDGMNLSESEMEAAMEEIMSGEATPARSEALLLP
jgi:anthranilate phosphoribosyltransferase